MTDAPGWHVEHHRASAADLHAMTVPADGRRRVWVLEPTGPAVVLGSTQRDDAVDRRAAASAGVDVVRRRSGGGAVWVAPGDPVWVDVVVPRGDPLWDDDVGRAFLPLGRAWQAALAALGVAGRVHDGPLVSGPWSDLVCFAGRGPGEVFAGAGPVQEWGGKLVGMSQRRTRAGARFQCALPRSWTAEPLRSLLRPEPPVGALDGCGAGVGALAADDLVAALLTALG